MKQESDFLKQIETNNKTHVVTHEELAPLLRDAQIVYEKQFDNKVWFERSIFTNWTCGIADCKYCYLSTKPKLDRTAVRNPASILAEALVCRLMGWHVGYITGGLRVEKTDYMVTLLTQLYNVLGYKPMMNYGPYSKREIDAFAPHVDGMGCAIESFDEELHKYICPSKPLPALLRFLTDCKEKNIPNFITIILGIGERKDDVYEVIENIHKYNITKVQLCFLKSQEKTVFDNVPAPDPMYMAWWCAKLRIAHPTLEIKIALVKERIEDFSLLLQAGANAFSRYMVFQDFATPFAAQLEKECQKIGRTLIGNFHSIPEFSVDTEIDALCVDDALKKVIRVKAKQYLGKLKYLQESCIQK